MNKFTIAAVGAALAVACVSASAADASGAFFINAGVGQAQYHVGHTDGLGYKLDDKDTAGALRFGYAWKVNRGLDLGVEGGYVNLGKLVAKYHYESQPGPYVANDKLDLEASGWLLGLDGKYTFANNWYVSARGGWFRSTGKVTYRYDRSYAGASTGSGYASDDADGDGWYGGVGVGYDFAPNFSLGLNYDNYHGKASVEGYDSITANIGTFMLSGEYRF